jgi:type I restriction enzyme S subunit
MALAADEGEVPAGWAWSTFGEVLPLSYGKALRGDVRDALGNRAVYGSAGRLGTHSKALTRGPAIIVGRKGSAGSVFHSPYACWPIDTAYYAEGGSHIDLRFAYFRLLHERLGRLDQSTAVPSLSRNNYSPRPLALPPLKEQHRIAIKIDELFGEIEAGEQELERARDGLTAYRRAVLKAAVTGELTRDWREANTPHETGSELLAKIIEKRLKEAIQRGSSALRGPEPWPEIELPSGWAWASIDQVGSLVQYGTSAKCSGNDSGVAVLRMGNIQEGRLDYGALKFLPHSHGEFPELLLRPGDVLFNRTNSAELVGKTAVFDGVVSPCSFASYLIRLRLCEVRPHYLSYFINSAFGRHWITMVASQQVGQANVNGTKLKRLTFPLPPLAEQNEIVRRAEFTLAEAEVLRGEIGHARLEASRVRQAILASAFGGRLVPQDGTDEPASALLKQLRSRSEATQSRRPGAKVLSRTATTSETCA